MNFTLFADTNVILDNILNRPPSAFECKQIFSLGENGYINLYTSHSCLLTVVYFLKKEKLQTAYIIPVIEQVIKVFQIVSPDINGIKSGLYAEFNDLEDAIHIIQHYRLKISLIS